MASWPNQLWPHGQINYGPMASWPNPSIHHIAMSKATVLAFTLCACMLGVVSISEDGSCKNDSCINDDLVELLQSTSELRQSKVERTTGSTYDASYIKWPGLAEMDDIKANYASDTVEVQQQVPQAPSQKTSGAKQQCFDARAWLDKFMKEPSWQKYSQGDQDAVLASVFSAEHLGTTNKDFVEFGFPDKSFSTSYGNGRHLKEALGFNNFLLLDGRVSNHAINLYKNFLTKDNIVGIFDKHNVPLEADYVSIDIDSCDLWVFRAITTKYRPRVMTVEYNSNYPLGDHSTLRCAKSDKYRFHSDNIYGASLSAIGLAAQQHGYTVVYVTPYLDAFLVRNDLLCPGTAVPLTRFTAATGKPWMFQYDGEQGPVSELVIDFKEWLAKQA